MSFIRHADILSNVTEKGGNFSYLKIEKKMIYACFSLKLKENWSMWFNQRSNCPRNSIFDNQGWVKFIQKQPFKVSSGNSQSDML